MCSVSGSSPRTADAAASLEHRWDDGRKDGGGGEGEGCDERGGVITCDGCGDGRGEGCVCLAASRDILGGARLFFTGPRTSVS